MIDVIRMQARRLMRWVQQIFTAPAQPNPAPIRVRANRRSSR
jgi:hypothetical protein